MVFRIKYGIKQAGRFLFAAGGGIIVGIGLVATIQTLAMSVPKTGLNRPNPTATSIPRPPQPDETVTDTLTTDITEASVPSSSNTQSRSPAFRYAEALISGDGDTALAMLSWVRDRLAHVQRIRGAGDPVRQERDRLARELLNRAPEGAVITEEGIEDQYVFVPGCQLELIGHDGGAQDLEAPAAGRDWIRITYPRPENAPRSPSGKPFKTLVVGVNWDANGMILKGNVIGNLEIERENAFR